MGTTPTFSFSRVLHNLKHQKGFRARYIEWATDEYMTKVGDNIYIFNGNTLISIDEYPPLTSDELLGSWYDVTNYGGGI